MKNNHVEDVYPLSPLQQAMLVHTIYAPKSRISFEQSCDLLQGKLHVEAFKQAWLRVVERHSIVRTCFLWEDMEEPLQVVRKSVVLPWKQYDWRTFTETEQHENLEALLQADRDRGFNLAKAPLMRLSLAQIAEDQSYFIWSFQHIILDGWSRGLILQEVFACYEAFCQKQEPLLPHPRPYRDYIAWLQQQDLSRAMRFWQTTLRDVTTPTRISTMQDLDQSAQEAHHSQQQLQLSKTTTIRLQRLAQSYQITLNSLMQGIWTVLLNQYSGSEKVIFGATVSGRPEGVVDTDTMIGMFLNILPVAVRVDQNALLRDWLQALQAQQLEAQQYAFCSLVQCQEWSGIPWNMPLFESLLVFENYPGVNASSLGKEAALQLHNIYGIVRTNYPLTLVADPDTRLSLHIIYDCACFDELAITRIVKHLQTLLETIIGQPEISLSMLPAPEMIAEQRTYTLVQTTVEEEARIRRNFVAPRTSLELQLTQIWEEVLQIHRIGVTDNFFALGGHSLLALRLILQIQKRLGRMFPLSLLGQAGNIRELASLLQQQNRELFESPVVALRPQGSRQPFFCIHPGSGNIICYYNLAYHLSPEQPFYALYDPDTQKEEFPHVPLEEMAARYLKAIHTVQPEGPYFLGGLSFGGIVAFEMAQQLTQQGQYVALLAILDSGSPHSTQGFADDDNAGYLAVITMEAIRSTGNKSLYDVYCDLKALDLQGQLDYVIEQMKLAGIELPDKGPRGIQHELHVFRTRTHMLQQYIPQTYSGKITFFQSTEKDSVDEFSPLNESWQKFSTQPIETYVVPGYHDTILDEPNVQILAGYLQNCLENAQER